MSRLASAYDAAENIRLAGRRAAQRRAELLSLRRRNSRGGGEGEGLHLLFLHRRAVVESIFMRSESMRTDLLRLAVVETLSVVRSALAGLGDSTLDEAGVSRELPHHLSEGVLQRVV